MRVDIIEKVIFFAEAVHVTGFQYLMNQNFAIFNGGYQVRAHIIDNLRASKVGKTQFIRSYSIAPQSQNTGFQWHVLSIARSTHCYAI